MDQPSWYSIYCNLPYGILVYLILNQIPFKFVCDFNLLIMLQYFEFNFLIFVYIIKMQSNFCQKTFQVMCQKILQTTSCMHWLEKLRSFIFAWQFLKAALNDLILSRVNIFKPYSSILCHIYSTCFSLFNPSLCFSFSFLYK